ncbi:MAG TPA: recombinase family protein [Pseudobdellovibrionaceae bacterium]
MSSCFYGFPIVAYISLALENEKSSAFKSVQEYCRNTSVETDLFAEEMLPEENDRPLWQKILDLVERNEISMIVVPSLKHISGKDSKSLSSFLTLLKIKSIRLKSIAEGIDSQRDSRLKILSHLNKENAPRQ